jgi:hypothetical protein
VFDQSPQLSNSSQMLAAAVLVDAAMQQTTQDIDLAR